MNNAYLPPDCLNATSLPINTVWHIDIDHSELNETRRLLKETGFCKHYAAFQSVATALKHLEHSLVKPDLVFLELFLPYQGGIAFIESIQASAERLNIKIIILTSWINLNPLLLHRAKSFPQVIGFLEKPFNLQNLNNIIYPSNEYQNNMTY
ncbi:MAG: response regulator [Bacteroidia bacterium]